MELLGITADFVHLLAVEFGAGVVNCPQDGSSSLMR